MRALASCTVVTNFPLEHSVRGLLPIFYALAMLVTVGWFLGSSAMICSLLTGTLLGEEFTDYLIDTL